MNFTEKLLLSFVVLFHILILFTVVSKNHEKNMRKSEFYQTVTSFFCSSVSYFNTIYGGKLKTRARLFKTNDVVSEPFVKISKVNI